MYTFTDGNVMAFNNFYRSPNDPTELCVREYISSNISVNYTYEWAQTDCGEDLLHLLCKKPSGDVNLLLEIIQMQNKLCVYVLVLLNLQQTISKYVTLFTLVSFPKPFIMIL